MTNISLRAPEVAARIVLSHRGGDLIKGAMNSSSARTLVDRFSRCIVLVKLGGNTTGDGLAGCQRRLKNVPESLLKSMTNDQGSEMAVHETLSVQKKMAIFFCNPHSPLQRGRSQNANRLARKHRPKAMDLSHFSNQHHTAIEPSLNHRPRKMFNLRSPLGVFSTQTADFVPDIALQL